MKSGRWTAVSQSFEWEREALEFLRDHLPDHDPWRAWSNFEFIDDEGRVNEVDALGTSVTSRVVGRDACNEGGRDDGDSLGNR